tara:strand:+ start:86 stop:745 length:660 start_codon:yes stop_codon:yes gene_type:complete
MPHRPGHSRYGGSTPPKKKTNPYKQAAQSMMSAGISSVSGSTTSDKKGNEAKKRQEDYRDRNRNNNNNQNNNVDPIVPKPKPKPDEKEKDIRLTTPGQDPYLDDRPKSKGIMKEEVENPFALQYNMDLTGGENFSLMATPTESVLQNETFQISMADYITNKIPEKLHDTVAASYALAEAAVTGDIELQNDLTDNSTIIVKVNNWGENMEVMYNLSMGGN